jgi:hypothetical protein
MSNTIEYEFTESGRREFLSGEIWAFRVQTSKLGTTVSGTPTIEITDADGAAVAGWFSGNCTVSGGYITTPTITMGDAGWYSWTLTAVVDGNTQRRRALFRVDE